MVKNPYRLLGVTPDAGDEEIRKAWLEKVRRFPPENAPDEFRMMREAYETISTRTKRLRHYLFSTDSYSTCPFEALTTQLETPANRTPPSMEELNELITQQFDTMHVTRKNRGTTENGR